MPGAVFYAITVTNLGPNSAAAAVITDVIPRSVSTQYPTTFYCVGGVESGTAWCGPLPTGVSCTHPAVRQVGTVTCTQATLSRGATMTIDMEVLSGLYFHNQLMIDTATVSSATFDPDTANNTATVANGGS
jgi:uncharacterized repeat protein (TIGR01451 family)